MAKIERSIKIKYKWWDGKTTEISVDHIASLTENAEEHIVMMRSKGFTSGALHSVLNNAEYRGWWEIT